MLLAKVFMLVKSKVKLFTLVSKVVNQNNFIQSFGICVSM